MKTKTKTIALVEIAIVLCSVFLVALPGIAADQTTQEVSIAEVTTTSEDDFILEIYGNANEDDCVGMRDYTCTARIICWLEDETTFADANYDGRISVADMTQIGLIILGRESELTIRDVLGEAVTVHKPVKRVISEHISSLQALRALDAADLIVGIDTYTLLMGPTFLQDLSELPTIGSFMEPDFETILSLNPDVYLVYNPFYMSAIFEEMQKKLPGVTFVCLDMFWPIKPEKQLEEMTKLGYIVNKRDEAKEFIDWYNGYMGKIKERTAELSEDEKPRVYVEWNPMFGIMWSEFPLCDMAGGITIGADLPGSWPEVDPEWVVEQNPDIIIQTTSSVEYGYEEDDPLGIIALREEILSRPWLETTTAVKDERVYIIEKYCTLNVPNYIIGTTYMARWFHPDLFEDMDPEEIHQEYLTKFMRLDYDLDEHGIFAYPPIEIDDGLAGIPDKWL